MKKEEVLAVAVAIRGLIKEANTIHDDLTPALAGVAPVVLVSEAQGKLNDLVTGLEAAAKTLEDKAES